MAERTLPDAAERRRAATDFETNLVVLAGAGTGKTSLLVERVLNAIGLGEASMAEIGAITFTEKAAGELRERVALGLEGLRALASGESKPRVGDEAGRAFLFLREQPGHSAPATAERALQAMEQLDAGTVTTIHGFCAELLRSYPVEAGVDPGFVVDSGERADLLLESSWRSFVDRELGADATRPAVWRRLLSRMDLREAAGAARESSGFGLPTELLQQPWPGLEAPEVLVPPAGALADEIEDLLERQTGLSKVPLAFLEAASRVLRALERRGVEAFREEMRELSEFRGRVEKSGAPTPNTRLDEALQATAKRVLGDAHRLIGDLWKMDEAPARALFEAVSPFALEYRERYLRQGYVDFDGLLALARNLLRDRPAVREAFKRRYRLLLVDEFQDTDPAQYEIVLLLAEKRGSSAAAAFEAELDAGRLFVVGDAKQSIYRFRGADYAAYRRAVERIKECGGAELNLVANFRSVPDVTEPVNRIFEAQGGCWEESRYQPGYVAIEAAQERVGGEPRVELWTVRPPTGGLSAEEGREAEGRLIAREIERRVNEGGCRYRDFTLLFRSFASLAPYLRPLRELGIPFVVSGGREFLERPEVTQLMAAFRTLARPADEAALLAFLRSPMGAVSDRELAAYAREGGGWDGSRAVDVKRFAGLARCFGLLRELRREIGGLPADAAFRRIVERTLALPLGAAAFEGAQRVANLRKLTAAAAELARDGRLSMEEVVAALEAGNLELVKTDQPLADDAAEAVRISTMHGMKGLESECIILPDLARGKARGGEEPAVALTRLPDGREGLAVKVGGAPNSPRVWHDLEDRRHGAAEEVRLLYVALTRARERLVLLARKGRGTAPWIEALAPWGYEVEAPPEDGEEIGGGQVVHRLFEPPAREGRASENAVSTWESAVDAYESAVRALKETSRAAFVAPSSAGAESAEVPRGDFGGGGVGLAVGRLLHRLLERWSGGDPPAFERALVRLAHEEAVAEGCDAAAVEASAREIGGVFLSSDLARRFETLKQIGREVPVLLAGKAGQAYRGSIDLLYEDDDGTIVVADYKTDADTDESALRERYEEQLRIYADAVQRAWNLPHPPRRELWLMRTGARVVID